MHRSKFTYELIQKILNQSEFLLLNSNINIFNARYRNEIKGEESIFNKLDYDQLIELRDRALTNRYKNQNNKYLEEQLIAQEKIIVVNNEYFIELVHQINEILKILNKLSDKGFIYYFLENEEKNQNNGEKLENDPIKKQFDMIEAIQNSLLIKIKVTTEKKDNTYLTKFFLVKKKSLKILRRYIV